MENLVIRQAVISDAKEILEVIKKAMHQYSKNSGIPGKLASMEETEKDIEKYISSDYVLAAILDKRVVATLRISNHTPDTVQISRFAVLPEMQKLGVGKILFRYGEDYIRKKGVVKAFLYTALSNDPSLRFYKSSGFEVETVSNDRGYPRGKLAKSYQTAKNPHN